MFAHPIFAFNNRLLREAISGPDQSSLLVACLVALYGIILVALSLYGGHRYMLVLKYLRGRGRQPRPLRRFEDDELPGITVQLPLYNEMYVIDRLLGAVARLDYPRDR